MMSDIINVKLAVATRLIRNTLLNTFA